MSNKKLVIKAYPKAVLKSKKAKYIWEPKMIYWIYNSDVFPMQGGIGSPALSPQKAWKYAAISIYEEMLEKLES